MTLAANLTRGPITLAIQDRIIGSRLYNAAYVVGVDIDSNHVKAINYTDVTLRYRLHHWGFKNELFLAATNVFNVKPPVLNTMSTFVQETDFSKYDAIGTYITAGIRFSF